MVPQPARRFKAAVASLLHLEERRPLALVADMMQGNWLGLTFFRGNPTALTGLRWGLRIYEK